MKYSFPYENTLYSKDSRLSRMSNGYDGIWVVVDRFTKMTHLSPIEQTFPLDRLAQLYFDKNYKII